MKHLVVKTAVLGALAMGLILWIAQDVSAQHARTLAFPTVNNPYGIDPATFNVMSYMSGMGVMPSMNGSGPPPGTAYLNALNQQMNSMMYSTYGLPPPGSMPYTNLPGTSLVPGLQPGQIYSPGSSNPIANPNQVSISQIISMVKAKVGDSTIQQQLLSSGSTYNLTTAQITQLKNAGVDDTIINAMQQLNPNAANGMNSLLGPGGVTNPTSLANQAALSSMYGVSPYGAPYSVSPYGSLYGSPYGVSPYSSPYGALPYGSPYGLAPYSSPYGALPYSSPYGLSPFSSPYGALPYGSPYGSTMMGTMPGMIGGMYGSPMMSGMGGMMYGSPMMNGMNMMGMNGMNGMNMMGMNGMNLLNGMNLMNGMNGLNGLNGLNNFPTSVQPAGTLGDLGGGVLGGVSGRVQSRCTGRRWRPGWSMII